MVKKKTFANKKCSTVRTSDFMYTILKFNLTIVSGWYVPPSAWLGGTYSSLITSGQGYIEESSVQLIYSKSLVLASTITSTIYP